MCANGLWSLKKYMNSAKDFDAGSAASVLLRKCSYK